MIRLQDLDFTYAGSQTKSLTQINLRIQKGEFILITGESGCGKTTLTRILNGLCPQFFAGSVHGTYQLDGNDALNLSLDEIGLKIGNVFQDPRSQFFTTNATDEIVFAMENRNFPYSLMKRRVLELAELLALDDILDRRIFELSSGQKQKIAIAAACAVHPEIIILDEPSANLDAIGTGQLTRFLKRFKQKGLTIIISEHRLHYLADLADRVIMMDQGKIRNIYTAEEARNLPESELIQMGLRLMNLPATANHNRISTGKPWLTVQSLSFNYKQRTVLKDLSLLVRENKVIAITGQNGRGKSTLGKIITGILAESAGTISVADRQLKKIDRIRQSFFVGQDADYQLYTSSVWNEITLNLKKTDQTTADARAILRRLSLYDLRDRHPVSLSGGQKQRVLLAAAMLRKRKLLVLDEPTSGLDGKHMRIIAEILREVTANGMTVLLITHDLELLQIAADEIIDL